MMGLAEVLREKFRIGPIGPNSSDALLLGGSVSLSGGEAEELELIILAHLADVLGSDETREVVRAALWPFVDENPYREVLAGVHVLAAVREVLGLPGGGA